ncbi:MAG: outer membrane beta-barrel domain-containing protein [Gammaproteobacteria bacterium]|nr:outer membrane beta-barrel domain-containing protein [Gammaproteobacteria bacterium]
MANRFCSILLSQLKLISISIFLFVSQAVTAIEDNKTGSIAEDNPVIEPIIYRKEVNESRIDSENFEATLFAGVLSIEDFGSSGITGARFAFHVSELFFFEASAGQSKAGETSYERLSGSAKLLTDEQRNLSYYDVSIGYNVLPGEAFLTKNMAFNTAFYLVAGMGSTRFANDERKTINYGFGYRFLATDWMAVHADVRDHVFDMELLGEVKTTHNVEMSFGLSVFF